MRWLLVAAAVCATAVAVWFFFLRAQDITNYPSAGSDIIALGDSLVYGTGASKGYDLASLLSARIGAPVINLGVPGDTTADVLARLSTLNKYSPKVVILLVGGNDYLKKVDDRVVFQNLARIIESLQRRGAIVLLVGIRGGVLGDPYAPRFKKLVQTYKTAYVPDALQGLIGNREFMSDAVHPSDLGYTAMAERIAPVLKSLLQ